MDSSTSEVIKKIFSKKDNNENSGKSNSNITYKIGGNSKKFFPTLMISILIFLLFFLIATLFYEYFKKLAKTKKSDKDKTKIDIRYYEIGNAVYYIVIFIGFSIALSNIGLETTTLITILGTFGLALSLSLQSSLSNITSGIVVSFNDLYQIGDMIEINLQNQKFTGIVRDFTLFSTILSDIDTSKQIIIPNSLLQNNVIVNGSNYYPNDSGDENNNNNNNNKLNLKFKHISQKLNKMKDE